MRLLALITSVAAVAVSPLMAGCSGPEAPPNETHARPFVHAQPSTPAAPSENQKATPEVEAEARVNAEALVNFFRFVDYRYSELPETELLAEASPTEAGVIGTVLNFEEGPQYYEDGGPDSGATVIMTVTIEDTFEGETPAPRQVDVLLPSTGDRDPAEFEEVMPRGTELVLYLSEASDLPPEDSVNRMVPVSPQGFVVGDDSDGIVYPLSHEIEPKESLSDQVPQK